MNWGYKIIAVYAVFVVGIMYLVFRSTQEDQDLVANDYYEQELKYQQVIDATARANALSSSVKSELKNDGELRIQFPAEMKGKHTEADILLYCTADKKKDITRHIETDDAEVSFKVPAGNHGWHDLKINWKTGASSYFNQNKLMIP